MAFPVFDMTNPIYISAQLSYVKANGLMPAFTQASQITGVPKNLLLAIASRESRMGLALDANWLGDGGNGIGIMQIDRRYHPLFAAQHEANDHYANILYGARYLKKQIHTFGKLKSAIAAYNAGPGNVSSAIARGINPDLMTTGNDYAADVLSRFRTINTLTGTPEKAGLNILLGLAAISAAAGMAYQFSMNQKQERL